MLIKNGLIFGLEGFYEADITIENDHITAIGDAVNTDDEVIDAGSCYVIPGLVDIHFHGCASADFSDGALKAIETIAKYELSQGITTICPATMTIPKDQLIKVAKAVKEYKKSANNDGAELIGINMEGPFISPNKKGAQKEEDILLPDIDFFKEFNEASGELVRLIDLAPERNGAMDFIKKIKNSYSDVHISIAHTEADYDVAKEAFSEGADHVTHLYNAMPAYTHRNPGVVGAASDSKCFVELIADGVHVHPNVVRNTFKLYDDRVVLISDSMRATGMPDGCYDLGGQPVKVEGNRATLAVCGNQALAGSVTNLFGCLKTAVLDMEIPLTSAVKAATYNPAKSIGIEDACGVIEVGRRADILLVDKTDFSLKTIIFKGNIIK